MKVLLFTLSVACFVAFVTPVYVALRHLHDYVKSGRPVDGDFPSNLGNVPYYCYQAPSKGPCEGMHVVWFFDVVRRMCMQMYYSGCGGNENRFLNKAECINHCGRTRNV